MLKYEEEILIYEDEFTDKEIDEKELLELIEIMQKKDTEEELTQWEILADEFVEEWRKSMIIGI